MLRPWLYSVAPCRLPVLWQKGVNRWQEVDGVQALLFCGHRKHLLRAVLRPGCLDRDLSTRKQTRRQQHMPFT